MPANQRRYDLKPPPPETDENYWTALLGEGEFAESAPPDVEIDTRIEIPSEDFDPGNSSHTHVVTEYQEEAKTDWIDIQHISEQDEVLELKVVGYNRGGLLVEWRSLRGFVPASQLIHFPATSSDVNRRTALVERGGQA